MHNTTLCLFYVEYSNWIYIVYQNERAPLISHYTFPYARTHLQPLLNMISQYYPSTSLISIFCSWCISMLKKQYLKLGSQVVRNAIIASSITPRWKTKHGPIFEKTCFPKISQNLNTANWVPKLSDNHKHKYHGFGAWRALTIWRYKRANVLEVGIKSWWNPVICIR